jgi:hypothetical protein
MSMIRNLVTAAVLVAALASCSGGATPAGTGSGSTPAAPTGPSAAAPGPAGDAAGGAEAAVETAFTGYNRALADRDFGTACALNAPESVDVLLAGVEQGLGQRPADCVEAFEIIYATPGAAELADATTTSAVIQDVAVSGDTATVTWSAEVQGQRPTVTSDLRLIDGDWRLVDTG